LWQEYQQTVIDIIVGFVLGALTNWFFYRRAEKPKKLGWTPNSRNLIISAAANQRQHLSVVYRGQSVENPYVLELSILNVGKQEIRETDFTEPISIDFGDTKLLAHDIIRRSSPKLTGRFHVETSKPNLVQFTPELLNPDEWMEFQFVTEGGSGWPRIDTRFAGQAIPIFNVYEQRNRSEWWMRIAIGVPATILFVSMLAIIIFGESSVTSGPLRYPFLIAAVWVLCY
jgi:hypothetical protein